MFYQTTTFFAVRIATFVAIVFISMFAFVSDTMAQTPCGNIIDKFGVVEPIEDCGNPFFTDGTFPYSVTYNSFTLEDGSQFQVPLNETHPFVIIPDPGVAGVSFTELYQQEGPDLRSVKIAPPGAEMIFTFTATGVYTLVVEESFGDPVLIYEESLFDKFFAFLMSIAFAQAPPPSNGSPVHSITFEVIEPTPEPTGASSVLFLPGIQASRLYKDGLLGTEDQLWPPNINQDVTQLSMNQFGVSDEDIYTRDVIDSVVGFGDIYGGFLDFLTTQKDEGTIHDFIAFAYDWRYDVFDIIDEGVQYENEVKSLVDQTLQLASESDTGKVTIIAHSNGGLLAKALMIELEQFGQSNIVDKIVFIATPQLGTPKAIGTILHGYDQSIDLISFPIIQTDTAREVINNLPGVYSLLPSEKYFDVTNSPIIKFDNSPATADFRASYGSEITSFNIYKDFLNGDIDSVNRSLEEPISTPSEANSLLLSNASFNHTNLLDNWVAPDGIEINEIIGVGLPTMKSALYRGIEEKTNCIVSVGPLEIFCDEELVLKPFAELTLFGDKTVVQTSAEAYGGDKNTYYVNLETLNAFNADQDIPNKRHANLTEATSVQELILNLINDDTFEIDFVSNTIPEINDRYEVEIIDSPVQIVIEDDQGNKTGLVNEGGTIVLKEEIPGSSYFEFGGTKYLIVPAGINRQTTLFGEDYGGYTLTIASLEIDGQKIIHEIKNATVTPDMVAVYNKEDGVFSTVTTDLDGDGTIDEEITVDGEIVNNNPVTYETLRNAIENLSLKKGDKHSLQALVKKAEKSAKKDKAKHKSKKKEKKEKKALSQLEKKLKKLNKKGRITDDEFTKLQDIINILSDD